MSEKAYTAATRWNIAAAAIAIHLCIGSVYAWSVFVKPLQAMHGWSRPELTAAFSIAIGVLGLVAAFRGVWMECNGPRKCTRIAAVCFGLGIVGAGVASAIGSLWLLYATYGVLGGFGLANGYVPPVSTLLKWFPDRRGLAGGMAVCGFGAGALITGPLATKLIALTGVPTTFWILGSVYFVVMLAASSVLRFPPLDYRPEGWNTEAARTESSIPERMFGLRDALKTPQFWLLWTVFFLNITAGITLISLGSLMGQEIVGMTAVQAGVMVGIMGVFNGVGRIGWSTASDYLRRPATFAVMIGIQIVLFASIPDFTSIALFQAAFFFIMTCYGGGFATCPAFIADLFGSRNAGAIYGAILTAWSAAGVFGPTLAATIREQTESYSGALYAISGILAVALACVIGIVMLARREKAGGNG